MRVVESREHPNRFARGLFRGIPSNYDRLAELLGLGQYRHWRRVLVDEATRIPIERVLDVATGPAGVAIALAQRTSAEVTGVDLTVEMLRAGVDNVRRAGLSDRIDLLIGRGEQLPFADGTFDALTFTYLLRYVADPAATVAELARVVKIGGSISSLEFAVPEGLVWHPLWFVYTRVILPLGGYLSGGRTWYDVGRFLGPSITEHYRQYPLDWQRKAWEAAGIVDVRVRVLSLGGGVVMTGTKAGERT